MSFPYLQLEGDPYTQGLTQGQRLGPQIGHNLEVYFRRFEVEGKLHRRAVLERSERYLKALGRQNPDYFAGMKGLADGAGFDLLEIGALNFRYEILYHQFAHEPPQGCTAFAVLPSASADGALWMGQNWDWMIGVKGALLHTRHPDGLETLSFTEAGIFGGKIGMNSAGLGLCINGLVSADDDWSRLGKPFHLRTYEVLRSRTLEEAIAKATEEPRSGSANFLLGQGEKAVNLETAPHALIRLEGERLVHANHFLDPQRYGVRLSPVEWLDRSHHRHRRLEALIAQKKPGLEDFKAALADGEGHPYAVCRYPSPEEFELGEPYQTVASVIMNLNTREMWISDGPPDRNPYERYRF
ncbi:MULTISPECIES: C45 family peptidase [unclassified Meiothermus]|uniref:C45 family autoproteolytic acyltransferase/hydolase n=1 Tax=unclassified Meiothermus TaxID=370471 RepID=UPI000D7C966C|nr:MULTISPECIES: C45 family peptidase [unclassified Meiothermus]PZA08109.1 peptidase C45 [Meiothermus sp. Pnk-1]RYM29970.1 peptidase C45 [Meiothermus sp. PNK-Is4]